MDVDATNPPCHTGHTHAYPVFPTHVHLNTRPHITHPGVVRHWWQVQMGGFNVLTDPVFSQRCSPVQWAGPVRMAPPTLSLDQLPPLDAVVLSHNHYDHLDEVRPQPPFAATAWATSPRATQTSVAERHCMLVLARFCASQWSIRRSVRAGLLRKTCASVYTRPTCAYRMSEARPLTHLHRPVRCAWIGECAAHCEGASPGGVDNAHRQWHLPHPLWRDPGTGAGVVGGRHPGQRAPQPAAGVHTCPAHDRWGVYCPGVVTCTPPPPPPHTHFPSRMCGF